MNTGPTGGSYTMRTEMAAGYEPPSLSMQLPHEHRASCHGAIGELQCDLPDWRDKSATVLSAPEFKYRPDGPAIRTLRTICYILVCVVCVVALILMIDAYLVLHTLAQAIQQWLDGIIISAPLGN